MRRTTGFTISYILIFLAVIAVLTTGISWEWLESRTDWSTREGLLPRVAGQAAQRAWHGGLALILAGTGIVVNLLCAYSRRRGS